MNSSTVFPEAEMAKKTERYDYAIQEGGYLEEREEALREPSRDDLPDEPSDEEAKKGKP
jgi:hypothetical protein